MKIQSWAVLGCRGKKILTTMAAVTQYCVASVTYKDPTFEGSFHGHKKYIFFIFFECSSVPTKGQIISEAIFLVLNSSKKRTIFAKFCLSYPSSFSGSIENKNKCPLRLTDLYEAEKNILKNLKK
jgi:hypothetical protein